MFVFVWWPQFSPPDQLICQQNLPIFPRLTRSSVAGLLNCQPAAVGGQRSRWQTDNQYWQWCAAPVSQAIVSLGTQCRLGKTFYLGPSIHLVLPVGQKCWLLFAKNSPRPNELKFHHARRTGQWRWNINGVIKYCATAGPSSGATAVVCCWAAVAIMQLPSARQWLQSDNQSKFVFLISYCWATSHCAGPAQLGTMSQSSAYCWTNPRGRKICHYETGDHIPIYQQNAFFSASSMYWTKTC